MGEKELSKYYYLKKEIEDIEERLHKLGYGVGSPSFNEMINSTNHTSIQEKITELKDKYIEARVSALEQYIRIEDYIKEVEDDEMRLLLRYRFIDLKKWDEIDRLLNNGYNYSKKKYYKWRKENLSQYIPR